MFIRRYFPCAILLLLAAAGSVAQQEAKPVPEATPANKATAKPAEEEPRLPALPKPVTGNAVALLKSRSATLLFSLMGMGGKKTWEDVTNEGYYLDPDWDQWYPVKPVP